MYSLRQNCLLKLLGDRRFWRGSTVGVLALLALANWEVVRWHRELEAGRRQNLLTPGARPVALQPSSSSVIRFDQSVGENLSAYWPHMPDARRCRLWILCGMSQMFAVNEPRPADQTVCEWLDDALQPAGTRVFGLAAPNLCNEEALLLLLAGLADPKTRPRGFLYGVCFDKFRNVDLRPGYEAFLRRHPALESLWQEASREYAAAYPAAAGKMQRTLDSVRRQGDKANGFESRLRDALGRWIPMIRFRAELSSTLRMWLFQLRNDLLGIRPSTKRPILRARYDLNRQFLGLMAEVARRRGVQLVLYVVPLNPLAESPYVRKEYDDSKLWLAEFCRTRDIPFANLEDVVPSGEWGVFMGGPDYKHFKGAGHRRTAEALVKSFGPLLTGKTNGTTH